MKLRFRRCALFSLLVTSLAAAALVAGCAPGKDGSAGDAGVMGATFVSEPKAPAEGEGVRIEFEVSEPTDVTVAILDRNGRVVRHLAGGVLGDNAPPPLKSGSLAQRLVWDGRDDRGRRLVPGKYRAEVGLGLAPRYSGSFGWNPRALGHVHGLAVGPGGSVYVMSGVGRDSGNGRFQVFAANGKYLRTILPRPGGLPLDRVRPLGEMVLADGERFPTCLLPQYSARHNQVPVVAPNGDLIFVNGRRRGKHPEGKRFQSVRHEQQWPRRLLRLAADGGAPAAGYLGPVLGKGFENATVCLALSADAKTVYVSGARHAVFRTTWGPKAKLEVFAGTPDRAGGGRTGLKDPSGICLDAKGNLYVADRGNHRIACFDAGGKLIGEIPVEWPLTLAVDADGGAVYAACGYKNHTLMKFDSMTARKPSVEMPLGTGWPLLALDAGRGRGSLYVANVERRDARAQKSWKAVLRLDARGKKLAEAGEISDPDVPLQPLLLGADRERELVYGLTGIFAHCVRWDGRSGKMEDVPALLHPKANGIKGMTAAADGTVALHAQGEHGRMDAELIPLPFEASGTYIARLPKEDCPRSFYDRGSCIAPTDGSLYHVHERGGYMKPMRVMAVHRDGTTKKDSIVTFETRSAAAVRVDNRGNIYVLDHLKPVGKPVPDAFAGKVKVERHSRFVYNYGSVIKFGPDGGIVKEMSKGAPAARKLAAGELQFTTAEGRGDFVSRGAQWAWYGVSMIQPALGREGYCMCWHPRFDVDGYARVFVPDQLRCRIVVLDTNGNQITSIGRYGNPDDRGPEVPLADPRTVMVTDGAAYIGDMSNNRIARAELRCRLTRACAAVLEGKAEALPTAVTVVRDEVSGISPRLALEIDWRALAADLGEEAAEEEAVRASACRVAGRAGYTKVLEAWMRSKSVRVRLAAVWSLYGGGGGEQGSSLLRGALADRDRKVRVAAADALLSAGDPSGIAEIFKGAASDDADVYKLAETAILKKLVVWDQFHPNAGLLEPGKYFTSRYPMGEAEVKALGPLLVHITRKDTRPGIKKAEHWFLREKSIYLLALSGRPEAAEPLLTALRLEKDNIWGRNRNRLIAAMGLLRVRRAVPDLVGYLARGRGNADLLERGDKAERQAATALVRIGDPKSVKGIVDLLDSAKPEVRELSRRTLSEMFDAEVPADRCLVPRGGKLLRVRVDELPAPGALKAAWQGFWKTDSDKYEWNPDGAQLRRRRI